MEIHFYKYQGTGNDFILIDNRGKSFKSSDQESISKMCDRRFGIGADGLILLENEPGFDFKMMYFNADGLTGSMCGNGGRCIVKFASDLGVISTQTKFLAADGPHDAFLRNELVHLKMTDVEQIQQTTNYIFMNTGSPHHIVLVSDIRNYPVFEEGSKIRYSALYNANGTNVNFVEPTPEGLWVRTYERGVEDETYSCGTGVTAAALSQALSGSISPVLIQTLGGSLQVSFEKSPHGFNNIYLIGPAEQVYQGTYHL